MKPWPFIATMLVALICLGLSVATVFLSIARDNMQGQVATQQAQLNSGILGQQGQQVRAAILQDLASASVYNQKIKGLLTRHGFNVQSQDERSGSTTNAPQSRQE
jgi:hypothetical protein